MYAMYVMYVMSTALAERKGERVRESGDHMHSIAATDNNKI